MRLLAVVSRVRGVEGLLMSLRPLQRAHQGYVYNARDVFDEYGDMILRLALANVGASDACDILQDVMLRLLQNHKPFREQEHLKAWLIRVTINLSRDHKKNHHNRNLPLDDFASLVIEPEQQELLDALGQLGDKDRQVIYLHYFEGYSCPEIAKLLASKHSTIISRLGRARAKLKSILQGEV